MQPRSASACEQPVAPPILSDRCTEERTAEVCRRPTSELKIWHKPAWSLDVAHRNRPTASPISHQANSLLMYLTSFEQVMSAPSNSGDLKNE